MPSNVVNANDPTSYVLGHIDPPRVYLRDRPPLTTDCGIYNLGDLWIDRQGDDAFILVDILSGVCTWTTIGGIPGNLDTLTGDIGIAVVPAANNINIQGGGSGAISFSNGGVGQMDVAVLVDGVTITIVGNQLVAAGAVPTSFPVDNGGPGIPAANLFSILGSTSTDFVNASGIETHVGATTAEMYLENRRFVSAFVVDTNATVGLRGEFTTISAAVTAATAAGGGTVYIRPGTYPGAFTLDPGVPLVGLIGPDEIEVNITGTVTINAVGRYSIENVNIGPAGAAALVVTSATTVVLEDCRIAPGPGFIAAQFNSATATSNCFNVDFQSSGADALQVTAGGLNVRECSITGETTVTGSSLITSNTSIYSSRVTMAGTSAAIFDFSEHSTGALESFNLGATTTLTFYKSRVTSTAAGGNWIVAAVGAVLDYSDITLTGTALAIDPNIATTTTTSPDWKPYGTASAVTQVVGVNAYNPVQFTVDSVTGVVTIIGFTPITGSVTTIGAVTADVLTIPAGAVAGNFAVESLVSAFESSTPAGAWYHAAGGFRTDGAATTKVSTEDIRLGEDAALTGAAISYVASGNNMIVRVTGVAGLTVNWTANANTRFTS